LQSVRRRRSRKPNPRRDHVHLRHAAFAPSNFSMSLPEWPG
jgi:hypothetical protein